jgi:hypothetical protein
MEDADVDDLGVTPPSPYCELEAEYCRGLEHERHMFAWCMQNHGGRSRAEADAEALRAYPYEPASDPCRGFVFHDEAWHWAMLTIHGTMYWSKDRKLEVPSADYREEAKRACG